MHLKLNSCKLCRQQSTSQCKDIHTDMTQKQLMFIYDLNKIGNSLICIPKFTAAAHVAHFMKPFPQWVCNINEPPQQMFLRCACSQHEMFKNSATTSPLLNSHDEMQKCVIYLCATMWHETYDEMLKILTSMFRLEPVPLKTSGARQINKCRQKKHACAYPSHYDENFLSHFLSLYNFLSAHTDIKQIRLHTNPQCLRFNNKHA